MANMAAEWSDFTRRPLGSSGVAAVADAETEIATTSSLSRHCGSRV